MAETRDELDGSAERLVVEHSPNAIIVVDDAGAIVLVNRQTERLFGYTRDELVGGSVDRVLPRGLGEAGAVGGGRGPHGVRRDGSEVPLEITLNPLDTENGRLVLATIVDTTDRQRDGERFRVAVEAAPTAMVMVNPEGRIVLVNRQTERMFGYPREELLGQSIETLVPERSRARHPALRHGFSAAAQPRAMGGGRDLYGLTKAGAEIPVEIGLNPIHSGEGVYVLAAIVDITERKAAEAEARRAAEELARSNRDLVQFAYVASHDLQEPLRAVSGCVELLRQRLAGRLDSAGEELITHTVEGARRMQTLINDLLAYSRIETQANAFAPVASDEVLAQALADLEVAIREAGATVKADPLPTVHADATQLGQVLRNLIANAIKFHGDRPPEIHVSAAPLDGEWVFAVRDNGIGIEARHFDRIFEIFQRLHTQHRYPGTGIGLAVCKRIVERHGGRIWVESTPGEGSTFRFTLPRRPP